MCVVGLMMKQVTGTFFLRILVTHPAFPGLIRVATLPYHSTSRIWQLTSGRGHRQTSVDREAVLEKARRAMAKQERGRSAVMEEKQQRHGFINSQNWAQCISWSHNIEKKKKKEKKKKAIVSLKIYDGKSGDPRSEDCRRALLRENRCSGTHIDLGNNPVFIDLGNNRVCIDLRRMHCYRSLFCTR
jgi:hypothetical protein